MNPTTLGPGARLRAAREAAELTRRELADRLGKSYWTVSSLERDQDPITLDMIHEVALAIGCDPHSIDARLATSRKTRD
jgi:transcriptional regulator with XRE-family HTH domain